MAGIYIHIPFCKSKCHYCNFFSLASKRWKADFLWALKKEISFQTSYLEGALVKTLYFGGGTPSLYTPAEIGEIITEIARCFNMHQTPEITLEANPDDLTREKINGFRHAGINRLSIGIQSFHDDDLLFLNRTHSARQAISCIRQAQELGFENISLDLIYGIPGLTEEKWKLNIETAIELGVPHISAYALTVEEGTAMDHFIRQGKMAIPSDEEALSHFMILTEKLSAAGFLHYEISNFAKNDFISQHNSNYWKGEAYLGLGPSAHSYNGISRRWNVSNLTKYLAAGTIGEICHEEENLNTVQRYNEFVMTSLRTMWGCSTERVRAEFGQQFYQHLMRESSHHLLQGNLQLSKGFLYISEKGKFLADGIISDLFFPS